MKPYYRKFHTLAVPSAEICKNLGIDWIDDNVRGASGPVQASFNDSLEDRLSRAWTQTFSSLGYPPSGDPFSGQATGGFNSPVTVDAVSKERSYSASAYYHPVSKRLNLHVLTGALVTKIVLEKTDKDFTATGVQFVQKGERQNVKARAEVVLAAGALQSPKILELSGIGGTELLRPLGIESHIDNPFVGENLQDHLLTGISFEVKDEIETLDALLRQEPDAIQSAMVEYQNHKMGPFCSGGVTSFAFMPVIDLLTNEGRATLERLLDQHAPDESHTNPTEAFHYGFTRSILQNADEGSGGFFMFPAQTNIKLDVSEKPYQEYLPGKFITLAVALLHPFSRGSVHVESSDPFHKPIIDPHYLSHPLDVEILARHLRYLETIAATEPMASLFKIYGRRNSARAYVKDLNNAKEYVRRSATSNWHPTSTCSMMPREKGGVVNERLIVYGTRNLRIVDASIMPIISRGNPQSSVYAIAERAADLIKADYNLTGT